MRTDAANVKQLARSSPFWHGGVMKTKKHSSKEERLAEALRANLRRRKVPKTSTTADAKYEERPGKLES
jgi:hypothetical protein